MIKKYIKQYKRKNISYALKGYRELVQKKKLSILRLKHNNMHNKVINSISFKPLFFTLSHNYINTEIILRQYLIQFLIRNLNFNYLMYLGGKKNVFFIAPIEWLNEIIDSKTIFFILFNKISISLFGLNRFLISLRIFFFIVTNNLKQINSNKKNNLNTAFFFNLVDACIPQDAYQKNIINWYTNWNKKLEKLKYISSDLVFNENHNVDELIYSNNVNPKYFIGSKYNLLKFFILYVLDVLFSFGYLLIGNPGNAIMLPELIMYRCFKLFGLNSNAGHYLFHYTWTIYRPLWTYVAEDRGSRITLFFTSLTATIQSPFGQNNNSFDYYPSTWPEYVVWSENHKNEIRKLSLSAPKIFVENYIPFIVYKENSIKLPKKSILIFDSEPQKLRGYLKTTGFSAHDEYMYYNKFIFKKFFSDILNVASANGFQVFHKRKRVLTYATNTSYKILISNLEKRKNFYSIHPHTNIDSLIQQGSAIIGTPFTSIPYLAQNINKPAIYYDPVNYVFKNDLNSNNVKVINNFNELSTWLKSIK